MAVKSPTDALTDRAVRCRSTSYREWLCAWLARRPPKFNGASRTKGEVQPCLATAGGRPRIPGVLEGGAMQLDPGVLDATAAWGFPSPLLALTRFAHSAPSAALGARAMARALLLTGAADPEVTIHAASARKVVPPLRAILRRSQIKNSNQNPKTRIGQALSSHCAHFGQSDVVNESPVVYHKRPKYFPDVTVSEGGKDVPTMGGRF
jgi:hypothetical protein